MADVFAYLYGFGAGGDFTKSVIIVTAPTGSTVTCTKGTTVKTATEKNGEWWFKNLDTGTWTLKATLSGQTATQTVNVTQFGVYRIAMVYRVTPEFTYTGNYKVVQDNDAVISDFENWKGNWKIRFLTSGIFTVTNMYGWDGIIDAFLVGGGGSGARSSDGGGGGGGGYTKTSKKINLSPNNEYPIVIGGGGGNTTAFGITAKRGNDASSIDGGDGGSGGGSGVMDGGSDGSDGGSYASNYEGGKGQGTSTREFGTSGATLYSGGGGGGPGGSTSPAKGGAGGGGDGSSTKGDPGEDNTGGGGGGGKSSGGSGGSGIVVIRNAR